MALEILTFVTGPFETNSFLVCCGGESWVIDPGMEPRELVQFLLRRKIAPAAVLLTHGHCDHIAGIADLREAAAAVPIWCPADDAWMLTDPAGNLSGPFGLPMAVPAADRLLRPGETLTLGEAIWQVLDTSGHTPGGASFYCRQENVVFTGDSLFCRGIGRTDFPGGDTDRLLANIRDHLLSLPDDTRVFPGHGPATTIGAERSANPFLA